MSDLLSSDLIAAIDFLVRSTLLIALAGAASVLMRTRGIGAASRHAVWLLAVSAVALLPLLNEALPQITVPVPHAIAIGAPDLSSPGEHLPASPAGPASVWMLSIYVTGVALLLARLAFALFMLESLWRKARPADTGIDVSSLAKRAGVRGQVAVRFADGQIAPLTWGRRILLPADAKAWPENRQRDILLHELCHVARYDSVTQLAATIVRALFWFSPALWFAHRALRSEQEQAVDDLVLATGASPQDYAQTLIDVAAGVHRTPSGVGVSTAIVMRSDLERRVQAILSPQSRLALTPTYAIPLGMAGLVVAGFVATAKPVDNVARLAPLAPLQGSLNASSTTLAPLQDSH